MQQTSRALTSALCCALMAAFAPLARAQTTAPVASPSADMPYAIGAQRNGVAKCVGRINQVTSFLTANTQHSGGVVNAPGSHADAKLVSTIIEAQGQAGGPTFVSASFAPGVNAGECSATYDAVTYWPLSCADVAASGFSAFKAGAPVGQTIATLDGGPLLKVYLMPAGAGCVSIKKEVVY